MSASQSFSAGYSGNLPSAEQSKLSCTFTTNGITPMVADFLTKNPLNGKIFERAVETLAPQERLQLVDQTEQILANISKSTSPEEHIRLTFLLHGTVGLNNASAISEQITRNASIISQTLQERREWLEREFCVVGSTDFYAEFRKGQSESSGGLSLQLRRNYDSEFTGAVAQVGFFIDSKNNSLVIVNLQGQQNFNSFYEDPRIKSLRRKFGAEFARITDALGCDPRVHLLGLLKQCANIRGIEQILAIPASKHPFNYIERRGFHPKYDYCFEKAGLTAVDENYFACKI